MFEPIDLSDNSCSLQSNGTEKLYSVYVAFILKQTTVYKMVES